MICGIKQHFIGGGIFSSPPGLKRKKNPGSNRVNCQIRMTLETGISMETYMCLEIVKTMSSEDMTVDIANLPHNIRANQISHMAQFF